MASARQHLKNARRSASGTLRGTLIRAAIAGEEGDHSRAVTLYRQLLTADRSLMAEILPLLESACRETGRDGEIERCLGGLIGKDESIKRDIAYAAIASGLEQAPLLRDCVEEFLLNNGTLAPLIDIEHLKALPPDRRRTSIHRICGGLRRLAISGFPLSLHRLRIRHETPALALPELQVLGVHSTGAGVSFCRNGGLTRFFGFRAAFIVKFARLKSCPPVS